MNTWGAWALPVLLLLAGCGESFAVSLGSNAQPPSDSGTSVENQDGSEPDPGDEERDEDESNEGKSGEGGEEEEEEEEEEERDAATDESGEES